MIGMTWWSTFISRPKVSHDSLLLFPDRMSDMIVYILVIDRKLWHDNLRSRSRRKVWHDSQLLFLDRMHDMIVYVLVLDGIYDMVVNV